MKVGPGFELAGHNLQFVNWILQFASLLFCFCKSKFKSAFKWKVTHTCMFSVTKNCDLQSLVNQNKLFVIVSIRLWPADSKPDTTQHSGLSRGHFVNKMAEHYFQWLKCFGRRRSFLLTLKLTKFFCKLSFSL